MWNTTADEVNEFFNELRLDSTRGELKPATILQSSVALNAFYKHLIKQDAVYVNPMDRVDRPKIKGRETIRLHHEEVLEFTDFLAKRSAENGARDALLVRTIYATGMRVSEVCNLRIEDIDDSETLRKLRGYVGPRSSGFVFLYRGHAIEPQAIQPLFQLYAPAGITPHKIRHSFAGEFYKATHDLRNLQETLGHASIQTTQIYVHTDAEQRRKAYQSFPLAAGM